MIRLSTYVVCVALLLADASAQTGQDARIADRDWPTYNGHVSGNRFSPLDQINTATVGRLAPKWIFTVQNTPRALQVTPLVVGSVMYVTSVNEAFALDARSGRELWHYTRPRTPSLAGDAA